MSATDQAIPTSGGVPIPSVYNQATGVWEESTGTRAGGPYVQIHDGLDVTQGGTGDAAAGNSTGAWSVVSLLKGLYALLAATLTVKGSAGAFVDHSVTGTGAAAQAIAANTARRALVIQAPSDNGATAWVSVVGTAVPNAAGSYELQQGAGLTFGDGAGRVPSNAVSVYAGTGDIVTIWEG